MKIFSALFFVATFTAAAQTPQVPHKMQFADLTLTIRDDARREIQKDVDAFTKYPKSFNVKVDRAKTYFPLIEKIFAEENVPEDLKYLVIQESGLIPDAVSVSNAVGFWQFKDYTAIEMGLRVDKDIDERLNIVSSSRAAARYLKKNNGLFDNWLFALQSYQMGAGGVMRSEKENKTGAKHMEITSSTYWYVKKFLAHKIAYEDAVKGKGGVQLLAYPNQTKRTLSDLAKEISVDVEELRLFNKWTKSGMLPDDRVYAVVIPITGDVNSIKIPEPVMASITAQEAPLKNQHVAKKDIPKKEGIVKINGIHTVKAIEGDTPAKLAARANADLSAFLKWNDISISDRIHPGTFYLLGKKRTRAAEAYHKVSSGENLWSISQKHGVQLKKLKKYNRISTDKDITPGMTLWLASGKPKDSNKARAEAAAVEVDSEAFTWSITPKEDLQGTVTAVSKINTSEGDKTDAAEVKKDEMLVEHNESVDSAMTSRPISVLNTAYDSATAVTNKVFVAKKTEHIVQPGETLYGIGQQYSLSVMDLVDWNSLNLQQGIKPGQVIKLTEPQNQVVDVKTSASSAEIEHMVRATDTVYSIARKYGVTIKELMEWNNKKDFNLSIGEKLKIPKK